MTVRPRVLSRVDEIIALHEREVCQTPLDSVQRYLGD